MDKPGMSYTLLRMMMMMMMTMKTDINKENLIRWMGIYAKLGCQVVASSVFSTVFQIRSVHYMSFVKQELCILAYDLVKINGTCGRSSKFDDLAAKRT